MGRKPMPERKRRSRTVKVRLTPEEHLALDAVAGERGMGSYVREVLIEELRYQKLLPSPPPPRRAQSRQSDADA